MKNSLPDWIFSIALLSGAVLLGFGVLCWVAPHLLFASEGYRTMARGIIGMLGAICMGHGVFILHSVWLKKYTEMMAYLKVNVFFLGCGPAIAFFNLGAMEPLRQATGINVFIFIGINLFVFLLPVALAFFGLRNFIARGSE